MVVLSDKPVAENLPLINTCRPTASIFTGIPVIDLLDLSSSKTLLVEACQEFGFFKVINHGVSKELMIKLEAEATKFFNLPLYEKEKAASPNPLGYGNKRIGRNGDMGWIEYLLFSTNTQLISPTSLSFFHENPENFRCLVNEYISAVREMVCRVLELIVDGLKIRQRDVFSRLLKDAESDSLFRVNHYPPCPELDEALDGEKLVGFGEHTDPQIMSAVRSNNTSGLEISLKDGTWVSVPPDPFSFFVNVGDSLQVMTNGRFRSVKHRVLADKRRSRMSMIYLGGPPLGEKIIPLRSLMEEGEESWYKEFTWGEYRNSAFNSRLSDNRLGLYEKTAQPCQ
ncbi:Gibberellin 2-beta-dioxygenase [Bertholletia excelsa]